MSSSAVSSSASSRGRDRDRDSDRGLKTERRDRRRSLSSSPSRSRSPSRGRRKSKDKKSKRDKKDKNDKKDKKDKRSSRHKDKKRRKYSDSESSDSGYSSSDSYSGSESDDSNNSDDDRERKRKTSIASMKKDKHDRDKGKSGSSLQPTTLTPSTFPASSSSSSQKKPTVAYGIEADVNPLAAVETNRTFVWKKKIEAMAKRGEKVDILSEERRRERMLEIEKVRQRKIERDREKEERVKLQEEMTKGLELESNLGWEQKEEEFHVQQALMGTEIRLREGREKVIDLLVKNIHLLHKLTNWEKLGLDNTLGQSEKERAAREAFINSLEVDTMEPHEIIAGLALVDLRDLHADILRLIQLGVNLDYWIPLKLLCEREIAVADERRRSHGSLSLEKAYNRVAVGTSGLPPSAIPDIKAMLEGRTLKQLKAMENEIKQGLEEGRKAVVDAIREGKNSSMSVWANVDVNYWDIVLRELELAKARASLHLFHRRLVKKRLEKLRQEAEEEERRARERLRLALKEENEMHIRDGEGEGEGEGEGMDGFDDEFNKTHVVSMGPDTEGGMGEGDEFEPVLVPRSEWEESAEGKTFKQAEEERAKMLRSSEGEDDVPRVPPLLPVDVVLEAFGIDEDDIVDEEEDDRLLQAQRHVVLSQRIDEEVAKVLKRVKPSALSVLEGVADDTVDTTGGVPEGEKLAADEEMMEEKDLAAHAHYTWQDKYRPRKPRYFNRVKTGYDWNKYNQTHYDKENPPPKVVQGYKFNIFYPDLIDPSKPPTYTLEKDPDGNPDYCVIRFSAGPPYEDVAFKIVNKRWNMVPKHGFKCVFQKGTLSLWFNFLRVFYRR